MSFDIKDINRFISKFLETKDVISLAKTCKKLGNDAGDIPFKIFNINENYSIDTLKTFCKYSNIIEELIVTNINDFHLINISLHKLKKITFNYCTVNISSIFHYKNLEEIIINNCNFTTSFEGNTKIINFDLNLLPKLRKIILDPNRDGAKNINITRSKTSFKISNEKITKRIIVIG